MHQLRKAVGGPSDLMELHISRPGVDSIVPFGAGIGNATSLPPLIVHAELSKQQTQRVIALIVATSQSCYAFAPALVGVLKSLVAAGPALHAVFGFAAFLQAGAILAFTLGGNSTRRKSNVQRTES